MEEGTVCDRLYFIEEGMVRAYYYNNDNDNDNDNDNTITSWFEIEGGYVYLPHSFFRGELAFKSVESLEPGLAWSISRLNLNRLAETYPCAAIIKDRVSEHYQVEYEYKLRMLRIHRAADRLAFFEARHPLIYRRAKLMHIASFLNMTPQTLSKLRLEQNKPRREK